MEYLIENMNNGVTAFLIFDAEDRIATFICGDVIQHYSFPDGYELLNWFERLPTHTVTDLYPMYKDV